MKKSFAIAEVVVKELFRRKDFYVLFIITVVLSVLMAGGRWCVSTCSSES